MVLTGPITFVSVRRSSCPGTSTQYWKKYSSTPFVRLNRVRTEGFCPARRLRHFPLIRVAENWRQLHGIAKGESCSTKGYRHTRPGRVHGTTPGAQKSIRPTNASVTWRRVPTRLNTLQIEPYSQRLYLEDGQNPKAFSFCYFYSSLPIPT